MSILNPDSFWLSAMQLYKDMGADALECLDLHRSVAAGAGDFSRAHYAGTLSLFVVLVAAMRCQDRAEAPAQRFHTSP